MKAALHGYSDDLAQRLGLAGTTAKVVAPGGWVTGQILSPNGGAVLGR